MHSVGGLGHRGEGGVCGGSWGEEANVGTAELRGGNHFAWSSGSKGVQSIK